MWMQLGAMLFFTIAALSAIHLGAEPNYLKAIVWALIGIDYAILSKAREKSNG